MQNFDQRWILGHVLVCTQNCHLNFNSTHCVSRSSDITLHYCLLSYLLTSLLFCLLGSGGRFDILKFGLEFGYEVGFEFKLEGFWKCFFLNVQVPPDHLIAVSGGSFLLGGSNKDTRRCFLWCLQASNSSSLLFSIEF